MRVNWNLSRILLISSCGVLSILRSISALAEAQLARQVMEPQNPAEAQTKPTPKPSARPPVVQTPPPKSEPAQQRDEGEALRISANLVAVPVSVTDALGQPVGGLTAQDFRLEEEGKPQQVVTLGEPGKTPVELALLIDVSGSVFERFQFQQQAAAKFLREVLKPTDAVSVFSIGLTPTLLLPRVTGAENAVNGVMNVSPTKEPTAFFDSVAEAARYLATTADPGARRVLVVMSDGEDTYSKRYKLDAALQETQRADCLFYSINPSGPSIHLNKISLKGQEAMASLASGTGGAAFLPDKPEDLNAVFRQIAAELQAQYLLGYYSTDERADGKFRRIAVRVPARSDLRVRARQGYYARKS